MAKESGLGWSACTIDDSGGSTEAIVNDVVSLDFATPRAVQDITGLDKSAVERLLLLADFSITLNGIFNDASSPSFHDVFKTVPSSSVARTTTLTISGQSFSTAPEVFYTDYPFARSATGELTHAVPGVLADAAVPTWA